MRRWPSVPLSEVLRQVVESHPVRADESYPNFGIYSFGRGLFTKPPISGATTSAKTLFRARKGQFIYSRLFAFEGAYGLVTEGFHGCFVSNEYPMFECDRDRLIPEYLTACFKTPSIWEEVSRLSVGMGDRRRRVQPEQFLTHAISLPPMDEQHRMLARIDKLTVRIDEASRLRHNAQKETARLRSSSITQVLNEIPLDGCLGDVLLGKPRNGWSAKCDGLDTGTPILSLGAVTGYRYRPEQYKWTSEATVPNAHYWLKANDLLITRSNTPELVGHAAIYNGHPENCIYPDLMMRLDVDERLALKRFVHYVLRWRPVRDYIRSNAKGTSPSMKKISQETVLCIPFPKRLALGSQAELVERLDRIERLAEELDHLQHQSASELDALLPRIHEKAFREGL